MRVGLSNAAIGLILGWVACAPAWGQAPRSLAPEAPSRRMGQPAPDVHATLEKIASAYRSGPVADRAVLRVTRAGGQAPGSAAAVVRVDAPSRRLRLELGPLSVWAHGSMLAAVVRGDPDRAAVWELDGPWSLGDLERLPPLLLPHLPLALGDETLLSEPLPWVGGVVWSGSGWSSAPGGRRAIELRGSGPACDVRLTIDPGTHRVLGLTLDWRGPGDVSRVELSLTPVDAGDPSGWAIDLEGRARVSTLAELAPRTTLAPKGSAVLETFPLRDAENRAWGKADFAPDALVLLAFRVGEDVREAGRHPDALAGLVAIADAASRAGAAVVVRVAGVFEPGSFSPEAVRTLDADWSPALALLEGDPGASSRVLWTGAGERFWSALQPGADAVVVVVRGDGALAGVVPLDGRGADGEALREEISRLINAARR